MAIKEFVVEVTHTVLVKLDDEQINDEFNEAFSSMMWEIDGLEDHAEHLAQMEARGLIGFDKFVEGYGDLRDINCSVEIQEQSEEVM